MYPVLVSLDPPPGKGWNWALELVKKLKDKVWGFKVGWPLIIEGKENLEKIDSRIVLDLKLADIGYTMRNVISRLRGDAVIAHAFVGYQTALEILREETAKRDMELYLVVSMSHRGSKEFIDRHVKEFIKLAYLVADGVVAPATRLDVLRLVRRYWPKTIISPGIGAQGAPPCSALRAGADLEIVGRALTRSDDPLGFLESYYAQCS